MSKKWQKLRIDPKNILTLFSIKGVILLTLIYFKYLLILTF